MSKPYIRLSGRYTAACENEKATMDFVAQHMKEEKVSWDEARRVSEELSQWFRENPVTVRPHTVKVLAENNSPIIVSRILRG